MKISEKGLEFIIKEEGEVLTSYLCPAGVWTIGVDVLCGAFTVNDSTVWTARNFTPS